MAGREELLYQAAIDAVPVTGRISYADLRQTLIERGQHDALPYIKAAKKRGALRVHLAYVDNQVVHEYERGS